MTLPAHHKPATERLGLFFLIWMGCFLFFNLLAAGLLMLIYGKEAYETIASTAGLAAQNIHLVRALQITMSLGIFALPVVIFSLLNKPEGWKFLRLHQLPSIKLLGLSILVIGFAGPLILWALDLNQNMTLPAAFSQMEQYLRDMEKRSEELLVILLAMPTRMDFMLNFLMIAIVPAIAEELLFRGALQQLLKEVLGNVHVAILLTGIFFSFIHFQFFGFLPRVMMGVLFGYLFYWSRNLWVPIFAHFLHNGFQVVMVYLFQKKMVDTDIETMQALPPAFTMVSTVLLMATLYLFDKLSVKPVEDETATLKK